LSDVATRLAGRLIAATVLGILLGGIVAVLGLVWGVVAADNAQWAVLPATAVLVGVGVGAFIVSPAGLIVATALSTLTEDDERQAADWKAFATYLKDVARGKDDLLDVRRFDRFLRYAAGFGLSESWVKRFERQSGLTSPCWFRALRVDDASAAFIAVMVASYASFGSGGSVAAGASGASGGGASGAG
jgi:uncharacterized membrane protein